MLFIPTGEVFEIRSGDGTDWHQPLIYSNGQREKVQCSLGYRTKKLLGYHPENDDDMLKLWEYNGTSLLVLAERDREFGNFLIVIDSDSNTYEIVCISNQSRLFNAKVTQMRHSGLNVIKDYWSAYAYEEYQIRKHLDKDFKEEKNLYNRLKEEYHKITGEHLL